jgi:hypothetical protein
MTSIFGEIANKLVTEFEIAVSAFRKAMVYTLLLVPLSEKQPTYTSSLATTEISAIISILRNTIFLYLTRDTRCNARKQKKGALLALK